MTQRLYYNDSYGVDFSARVVERLTIENQPAVILDHSYFYPTGGGQPFDTGVIGGVRVLNTISRDGDAEVVHVLAEPIAADEVTCRVDWSRRFDHMQHHTGQHILTQAFVKVANANTVSFHLSDASVTIDLDMAGISPDVLWKVEDYANQIVWENHPVTARLVKPDDAEGVRIRKMPDHILTDGLRVIDIDGFDVTACGGTHVGHTAEIGLIKTLKLEKRGEKTRVEFRCGGRALADYRDKNNVLTRVAGEFNARYDEVDQAIDRLREDLKQAQRSLKATSEQLVEYQAEHLLNTADHRDGFRLVKAAFENRDVGEVRALASRIAQGGGVIALLGTSGEKAQIILARSADLPHDLNPALKRALPLLGNARGGGQPGFTQGGGVKASLTQVQAALDEAEQAVG